MSAPKQALLDYYCHQVNRHRAPHKDPAAVDYDALNALIDRVSQLLPPAAVRALQEEIGPQKTTWEVLPNNP